MAGKIFEVGDVLPATTQLRISWTLETPHIEGADHFIIKSGNNSITIIDIYAVYSDNEYEITIKSIYVWDMFGGWISPYTGVSGNHAYIDVDTSAMTELQRTISSAVSDSVYSDKFYWEDLNAPSGYTITFNSNGGTTISDIEEATELPTLPIPTKSGYTFVAWYYESNFQTRAKAGDTIESNVTLYAKWHNLGSLFTEIADAIRSKDGTSENIRDVDFGERVKQIQGAIELTQAEYDALETKDANTYYLIVEE